MLRQVFITGGSGFIGQRLVQKLALGSGPRIKVLVRRMPSGAAAQDSPIEYIPGDLLKPETYRAALKGCDAVVHLAATTGRASPDEYDRVNVEGTKALLLSSRDAGVPKFLHVSTIAAGYADQRYYHYAKTKGQAEALVRESGLRFEIVRPTVVLGDRSPIWETLVKIAGLPVIPLPESRPVRVQPIHVNDVVRGLELVIERDRFDGETLELGGATQMPFREFLALIQTTLRGRPGKIVSVPLGPIRLALALIEPALRPLMPITAGQLSLFANDSIASENWLVAELRAGLKGADETVAALVSAAKGAGQARPSNAHAAPGAVFGAGVLSDHARRLLEKECETFASYLIGMPATAYIKNCYVMASQAHGLADDRAFSCLDRAAVGVARVAPALTRCADACCAFLSRSGLLRRKLVLLAAILEHASPTSARFDHVEPGSALGTFFALAGYGFMFALSLVAGSVLVLSASAAYWVKMRLSGSDAYEG